MAIEYSFDLGTQLSPATIADVIQRNCAFQPDDRPMSLVGDGIYCAVGEQSVLGREIVADVFGFDSPVGIYCRLSNGEYKSGWQNLMCIWLTLLEAGDFDMVLLCNGEKCIMMRQAGIIYVEIQVSYQAKCGTALADYGIPFVLRKLPRL